MATTLMTPGVYIEEKNAFPGSAVAVATAVPVFIGYTEKAERNGKSLSHQAVRVTSFAEYVEIFGTRFKPRFTITNANPDPKIKEDVFFLNGKPSVLKINANNTFYLYDSMRLFYANGGSDCYIISVDTYGDKPQGLKIDISDFTGSDTKPDVFDILAKEYEPTLIVIPDIIALGAAAYDLYKTALLHCSKVQSRFGIFDIAYQSKAEITDDVMKEFRTDIGTSFLNYGAAYYPWLNTSVVQSSELDFENLDVSVKLDQVLPESKAKELVGLIAPVMAKLENERKQLETQLGITVPAMGETVKQEAKPAVKEVEGQTPPVVQEGQTVVPQLEGQAQPAVVQEGQTMPVVEGQVQPAVVQEGQTVPVAEGQEIPVKAEKPAGENTEAKDQPAKALAVAKTPQEQYVDKIIEIKQFKKNYHQSLVATSLTYVNVLEELRSKMNELPPSGAMAGIYTLTDSSRGVWKAPANVSLNMVQSPMVNISHDQQQTLNVDVMAGKSVNVIRAFPGIGTMVWGARTLDGNSQDWRYINVRRTLIMLEQSIKLAARAYVFEPNDANTWVTVSSMINNFLYNIWRQGALAGAVPEQAYSVQLGLGSTMTPNDILDGVMRITIKVAIVKPAEFIVITFQQQQQQS